MIDSIRTFFTDLRAGAADASYKPYVINVIIAASFLVLAAMILASAP